MLTKTYKYQSRSSTGIAYLSHKRGQVHGVNGHLTNEFIENDAVPKSCLVV